MIENSPLIGQCAVEMRLSFGSGAGLIPIGNTNPLELCEWRTDGGQVEELELFVFPFDRVFGEGLNDDPLYNQIEYELQLTQGAPTSGKSWSTSQRQPFDVFSSDTLYTRNNLWVSDHGLRVRVTCTQARLRLVQSPVPVTFSLFASFTPCSGMPSQPVPPMAAFPHYVADPTPPHTATARSQPIAKGAREALAFAASNAAQLFFYDAAGSEVGEPDSLSEWDEWRHIPAAAVYVDVRNYDGTSLTPIAAEVHFR